jgi:hypothetical protein
VSPFAASVDLDDITFSTLFSLAFAGFFRIGELTYDAKDVQSPEFVKRHVTRSDISFSEDDSFATIRLKASKTDYLHEGVSIVVSAAAICCPVQALRRLFEADPQPGNSPLFRLAKGAACSYQRVAATLKKRLTTANYNPALFSGHSFRKGAATEAARRGLPYDDIKILGRWKSDSIKLYITHDINRLVRLSYQVLHGHQMPILRTPATTTASLAPGQSPSPRASASQGGHPARPAPPFGPLATPLLVNQLFDQLGLDWLI